MNKIVLEVSAKCRMSKATNDTLAHFWGQCVHTKSQTIRSHDEIHDFITKQSTNKKSQIIEEALFLTTTEQNLNPDLVVKGPHRRCKSLDHELPERGIQEQSGEIYTTTGKTSNKDERTTTKSVATSQPEKWMYAE
jgi:hypothetical protein